MTEPRLQLIDLRNKLIHRIKVFKFEGTLMKQLSFFFSVPQEKL